MPLITERMIRDWACLRDAEGELPLLTRRLIARTASVTAIVMPGGDAVNSPGLDGDVTSVEGDAWVPKGRSCWEMGCDHSPATKANNDFRKRTEGTPAEVRRETTFVFVTPRRWNNKEEWRRETEARGDWRAVRVYDSRDLEHWLEETPAAALWFGDRRGVIGPGVEPSEATWRRWAGQTDPAITEAAFLAGREKFVTEVIERLRSGNATLTLTGDSREEVVALVAAVVNDDETLRGGTVVVTAPEGWRFVDANPDLKIAVACSEEVARAAPPNSGRLLVIPRAAGGLLAAPERDDTRRLPRPERIVMRNALTDLGLDPADADRWSRHCGRSWAVWRRLNARNPAICHPSWLERPEAGALSTVILIGAWNSGNENDRAVVAEVAGREYAAVEADLSALAQEDDSPVLRIGSSWRAKAPLELLHLWGARLSTNAVDRFMNCLQSILETPDPVLELESDDRWAAAVYGKIRGESGALINSMLNSLVKLSVRGEEVGVLRTLNLESRAARLVNDVLNGSDRVRWLSVSSFLSELAEAAPEAFLRAVENGLRRNDNPVAAIIAESSAAGSGITGRCWHADLLWALERLAWAPQRLARVADILARLASASIPGNWVNTPLHSLASLFRSWWPQVTAPLKTRLDALDRVVDAHPDVGWDLLVALGLGSHGFAMGNATPIWRDDDAGAVGHPGDEEILTTLRHIHERAIQLARGNARRLSELVEHVRNLHPDDADRVWALVEEFSTDRHSDEDREQISDKLRYLLYWHLNIDERPAEDREPFIAKVRTLYGRLQPRDLVIRHRWLLASRWGDLPEPDARKSTSTRKNELQREALAQLWADGRPDDINRLVQTCGQPSLVGVVLATIGLPNDEIVAWVKGCLPSRIGDPRTWEAMAGLLRSLTDDTRRSVTDRLLRSSELQAASDDTAVALLRALPFDRETWTRAEDLGQTITHHYWETTDWNWCRDDEDMETAAERLLEAGRPCAAFHILESPSRNASAPLLIRVLSGILHTTEPPETFRNLELYFIRETLENLANDRSIDDDAVIHLEFGFAPLLQHEQGKNLRIHRKLARDPGLFVELLAMAFRSEDVDAGTDERDQNSARHAYYLLDSWRRPIPGTTDDGTIDRTTFTDWIRQALDISAQRGRGRSAQSIIGQMLAHAPADPDGVWPCASLRDVLNDPDHGGMRDGLHVGLFNKRGVTSRAHDEGGAQERTLASQYRGWADALASTHWRLADVLSGLAKFYEDDGKSKDANAAWREEE